MAIIRQQFIPHNDGKGTLTLRNTIDFSAAIDAARETNEVNPGGYFGDKNSQCRVMGYIPEEMWNYDPWLIQARKARNGGDKGQYAYYLNKFFEIHQIVNRIRRDAMRDGVRRFYIDYAQKITVRGAKTKLEAQAYASDLISQTAQELNVSIVVLAQVGRAATKNPNGRPEAVDIADCDNWARDCGQLAFLHRPQIDDFHPRDQFGVPLGRDGQPLRVTPAEFLVRLNRFGLGEADVKLGFYGERGAFVSPVLE